MLFMDRVSQQEQQGFFPSIVDINCQPHDSNLDQLQKPFDYQPRVLARTPIQKKLPIQIIEPVDHIPIIENNFAKLFDDSERESLLREQTKSPYEKYVKGNAYKLVYSKNKNQPFSDISETIAKREINLVSILKYDPKNYMALKQQKLQKQTQKIIGQQQSLVFDSRFECGNLLCVYESLKEANTYDCFIEYDTNTVGYSQWFYFSVQNMQKQVTYKFNVVNMSKKFSFFKIGMKPTLFSTQRFKKEGNGWFQKGHNIKYKSSDIYGLNEGVKEKLYCASFELDFDYESDYVTISPGTPYSYSRLIRQLKKFKNEAISNGITWHQKTICHTVSSNQVPYLIITKIGESQIQQQQNSEASKKKERKIIVITARQHSGQLNSSFIMQKILKIISECSNSKIQWLLNRFQFRIFPMVNVDGVIYGNFRCDLVGFDLNRCWKRPIGQLQPQVMAIKKEIQELSKRNKIVCFIDLHSHSKQLNIFSYCNKYDEIQSRLYSFILSKNCPFFQFPACTFGLSSQKESTARAVIGNFIHNSFSMTIQSSSYAYKKENQIKTFNEKSYEEIASSILHSLKVYFGNSKYKKNLQNQIQENLFKFRAYTRKNFQVHSGSDSQPLSISNELQSRLKSILPKEFIAKISKKFKEQHNLIDKINIFKKQIQLPHSDDEFVDISPKRERLVKITRKKPSAASIEPRHQSLKKRHVDILSKRNIDKQTSVVLPYACRSTKFSVERIKSQPKQPLKIETKQPTQQDSVRYSTPNKAITNHNAFKNSMKILYKQLRNSTHQQQCESQLLINNARQLTERKLQTKNLNKLEAILKIRRKVNNFKSIISRQREASDELTLLKIRSEYASSTLEAVHHSISPAISSNSKMDQLINSKQTYSRDRYVSHITFLNKFLRNNIKDILKPQK